MKLRKFLAVLITVVGLALTTNQFASADPAGTGPITLDNYYGLGNDLNAVIVAGHSQYSGSYSTSYAFDGNQATQWATYAGTGSSLYLDIDLTSGAPGGAPVGAIKWHNRPGSLENVKTMEVILSQDATFGNGDDVTMGPLNVNAGIASASFSPTTAKYVRLHALTTGPYNPGATEIGLFAQSVVNPVTLADFSGPGEDLSADLIGAHSEFNASYLATNAFDGNLGTQWASRLGTGNLLTLDLGLTRDAPNGVMLDGFLWDNRDGALDLVQTMELIASVDDVFGNGDDTILGPFDVDGFGPVSHSFDPTFANFLRFHSLTTVAGYNPGAQEIQLFGTAVVPEPHSIVIWSILGICLAGYGYRRRRNS